MNPLLPWLHFPVFGLLVFWLWHSLGKQEKIPFVFWSSLLFKLFAGFFLGWMYLYYLNGGDTWAYHNVTIGITDRAKDNPAQYLRFLFLDDHSAYSIPWKDFSNSFFFLKISSILHLLTFNTYLASSLYLSLFSFWGCWFLAVRIRRYFPSYGKAALIAFLFFPSIVFWTCGLSKDSVFMGSLCFTVGLFLQISRQEKKGLVGQLVLLTISIWLLWRIKFFLAAVLVVLLTTFLLMKLITLRVPWLQKKERQPLVWLGLLGGGAFVASYAHPTFNLSFFVRHIVWNYRNIMADSDPAKPLLVLEGLQPSLWSVVLHAPEALFQMVFRPYVWEPGPFFYKMAGLENLLLLFVVVLTVGHLLRYRANPALPSFLGVMLLFFLIGGVLVSLPTPNFGSLHRYRAPLLPFFLLPIIAWGPIPQWLQRLSRRRG